SVMSSPPRMVVTGGKMVFAMERNLTPIIPRMIQQKKRLS
ncbi:MAG: phosphoribulokinase, partial [Cyanobacteriota bacterium]